MIYAQEKQINATEGYSSGDSGVYETFTDSTGELFRSCQRKHGRCISSMYVETGNGNTERIGWVFEKKRKYTDTNEKYLCETWVTLHKSEPVTTTKYDYLTNY